MAAVTSSALACSNASFSILRSLSPGPVTHLTEQILAKAKLQNEATVPLSAREIAHLEASLTHFIAAFNDRVGEARELYKSNLETAVRTCFWLELKSEESFVKVEWILRFAIACVDVEIIDALLPYVLFHEACDWGDSGEKEQIANLFVSLKEKWRSSRFSGTPCRNMLIRFTTELLSRLPKTTSARARGRLLCYVSARIPMSDKGAANTIGEFNTGRCPTTAGLTTGSGNNVHVNAHFANLCNLLDCLKNPNLILTPAGFTEFKTAFESVLELMTPTEMNSGDQEEGEHIDDALRTGILTASAGGDGSPESPRETKLKHVRFIPDPTAVESDLRLDRVKRNVLTRFLVVVQYLCLPAKPKGSFEPSEEQLVWCDQMVQTALAILSRTNPHGPSYVERITDHLESEAAMSIWKDAGCPPLPSLPKIDLSGLSPHPPAKQIPYEKVKRLLQGRDRLVQRKSIRDLALSGPRKTAGDPEVSKLLNRGPNSHEEFQNLGYQPPLIDFFIPVVEQALSGAKLKDIYNDKFQWRALRILGKRTHIHFSNEAEKMDTKDIGTFLENYILNLTERNPILQAAKQAYTAAHPAPILVEPTNGNANGDDHNNDNLDDLMDQDVAEENGITTTSTSNGISADESEVTSGPAPGATSIFSKEQIRNIAGVIAAEWEKFAHILKFGPDSIEYWKSANADPVEQAVQMLQVWMETLADSVKDSNDELMKFISALKDNYNFEF
ncbi:hypothetical protein BV898_19086 [Hypsibius exemplaris]|uniref:Death domain-containing protein n=1 Tax=Hypsibius exemplaris TaxID=2072580 RepID=A0A9X6NIE6_HYPEX|nr:hypothetical protein BV898_19086 [Hypsibius exemplaris]